MKKIIILMVVLLIAFGANASASTRPLRSTQSYYQGYPCDSYGPGSSAYPPACSAPSCAQPPPCSPSPCAPCQPSAPACGTECAVTICAIGVAILAVVGAAAIILSSESVH